MTPQRLTLLHALCAILGSSWMEVIEPCSWEELPERGFTEADVDAAGYAGVKHLIPEKYGPHRAGFPRSRIVEDEIGPELD